ncbi:MAG TPA: DUF4349 domain-containing protein [Gemmatimonadales bacterium]|jgi:hypothetical protein
MSTARRWMILLTLTAIGCEPAARLETPAKDGRFADQAPAMTPRGNEATSGVVADATPDDFTRPSLPDAALDPSATSAMIIRTGQASLQIDSLEAGIARLRELAQRVGGYVANSQIQAGVNQLRSAVLEIKVPAVRFDELTSGLSPIGTLEYLNVTAEDVGEEFTDVSARVSNSRRLEQRIIDILATRTGKLSDVLQIERELARVREEIERMEGRLRYLKAHAATSSLTVTLHEKSPLVGEPGSGGIISDAFRQAWRNFLAFIARGIESLGVLVPLGILVVGAALGVRRVLRARQG